MFEATVRAGVCRLRRPGTRWLSTGVAGGSTVAPAAYNVTVPEEFDRTDLDAYAAARRERAGFESDGPTLLTAVSQRHARRARLGPTEAVATAGLSNPAALPVRAGAGDTPEGDDATAAVEGSGSTTSPNPGGVDEGPPGPGTVNLVVGTTRSLEPGTLAGLLAVAVEAKAATLLARAGVPGTTSDAVAVACDPDGTRSAFAGSATEVGRAARACVRDALCGALDACHDDPSGAVAAAEAGVLTDARAEVSRLDH